MMKYYSNIVSIANTCINPSYWLPHFKKSLSIIIPKLNKSLYNILKVFCPIVLFNILGKLIEKEKAKDFKFILLHQILSIQVN